MKKTFLFFSALLILTHLQPLPAKDSWLSKMQYIPGRSDACLTLNLKALQKYMEKNGIPREEFIRLLSSGREMKPLEKRIYTDFVNKLKWVAMVFDTLELKKKQPNEFLILIEGEGEIPDFYKSMEKVKQYTYKGNKVYEVEKKDGFFLCRINSLYLIGNKNLVEAYLDARKAKKKTISPGSDFALGFRCPASLRRVTPVSSAGLSLFPLPR